ncbi:MAG: DNA repair protein RecO [Fibromonadales bacterium]|nr:DNA repair protein RecO [Fibromonadales bacterium]
MRTQIIVLHRYAYGDSSWIVKALSPDIGLLSLLVKGAKSKNSQFKAGIDPLAHSEIELRYNRCKGNSSLIMPKEAFLQNYFPKMRMNLQSLASAQLMAEILLKLGNESSHAEKEFKWLLNNLESLELNDVKKNSLSLWLDSLCGILGYAPMLSPAQKLQLWSQKAERIESFFLCHLKTHTGALETLRTWDWLLETRRLSA